VPRQPREHADVAFCHQPFYKPAALSIEAAGFVCPFHSLASFIHSCRRVTSLLLPTTVAIVLALLRGGSLTRWGQVQLRGWPILICGLLIQLVLFEPPVNRQAWAIAWGPWLWVGSLAAVLAVLLVNGVHHHRPTLLLLPALGVLLNLTVVLANGGYMPRSSEASFVAHGQPTADAAPKLHNTQPMTADSRLTWLGDVFPEPPWVPLANVLSLGDVLLSLGLAVWAYQITRQSETVAPRQVIAGGA
jgi:hypothetical protein